MKKQILIGLVLLSTFVAFSGCTDMNFDEIKNLDFIDETRDENLIGVWNSETIDGEYQKIEFDIEGNYYEAWFFVGNDTASTGMTTGTWSSTLTEVTIVTSSTVTHSYVFVNDYNQLRLSLTGGETRDYTRCSSCGG